MVLRLVAVLLLLPMAACRVDEPRLHSESSIPERLAEWGMLYRDGERLRWSASLAVYDLSTPLFSDYAHKLRTIYIPKSGMIASDESGRLHYPVGTVFSKTFYYPKGSSAGRVLKADFSPEEIAGGLNLASHRLLETRLLIHYESGWKAVTYVWNEAQTEARRKITGALIPLILEAEDEKDTGDAEPIATERESTEREFTYVVPDGNQCLGCHATAFNTRQSMPIGPARPDFINRESPLGLGSQLAEWQQRGWLDSAVDWPKAPDWRNKSETVAARARAYLEINCAHCHSATGAADTSGLWLDRQAHAQRLGLCKPPIAAGQGTGGRRWGIDPGQPDNSILVFRMESLDPGAMMPELGRSLVHEEAVSLIRQWVSGLGGRCAGEE